MLYLLSLGSNKGNSFKYLKEAIRELNKLGTVTKKSAVYKTSPVGHKNQDDFLNMVLEIQFEEKPSKLLEKIKTIEKQLGREKTYRWGPREIDIDIIDYSGPEIISGNLHLPHDEMNNRKFVLIPLSEINPGYADKKGISVFQLIEECRDDGSIEKLTLENNGTGWI